MTHSDDFDPFADGYTDDLDDLVGWSGGGAAAFARYKALYLQRTLEGLDSILDFGCGIGLLGRELVDVFPDARIDGYDISEESLAKVDDALRKRGTYTSDFEELHAGYDVVIISNVLHHVRPEYRDEVIAQATEQLTRGGHLVIFEHNPFNPLTRMVVASCEFDRDAQLLTRRSAKKLLKKVGMRDVCGDYVLFFPPAFSALWPVEPALARLPLGAQYAARGRK